MDGVVEIITGRERRQQWSTADKLRLVRGAHGRGSKPGHTVKLGWRCQGG